VPGLLRHPVWWASGVEGGRTGVVVVPGIAAADASTGVLRRWLDRRGHAATGAGLGVNVGCTEELVERLERRVEAHAGRTGARRTRRSQPGRHAGAHRRRTPPRPGARLAMLGSPVLDPLDARGLTTVLLPAVVRLSALGVRGLIDGNCLTGTCGDTTAACLAAPLQVPAVAIYSRQDGAVGWRSCRDPEAEWVEVTCSHTGMGTDPAIYAALGTRLAAWTAVRPAGAA
jgi:hypothetical protein